MTGGRRILPGGKNPVVPLSFFSVILLPRHSSRRVGGRFSPWVAFSVSMLHPKKQKTPSTCSGPTGSRASRNPHLKKFRIHRASKIEENEDPPSTSRFSLRQIASRANRGVQKKILKLLILILGKQQKQNKFRHAQAVKHTSSVDDASRHQSSRSATPDRSRQDALLVVEEHQEETSS